MGRTGSMQFTYTLQLTFDAAGVLKDAVIDD
jgi:hypothetical protein